MFAYCLFCQTQRCSRIAQLLEIKGISRSFSPKIMQKLRVKGENQRKYVDLLPGYVFAFTEEKLVDYSIFFGIDGVIRKVGCADEWYELQGADREFALTLLEKDGVVGGMKLAKVGDEVTLEFRSVAGGQYEIERTDPPGLLAGGDENWTFVTNVTATSSYTVCPPIPRPAGESRMYRIKVLFKER